jgi:SAM-dependent methyltransferase
MSPAPAASSGPSTTTPDPTGYGRLVQDGHYANAPSGLVGKFDNVRRIWEDQITRFAVRPAILRLRQQLARPLRVLDLGCGSGEGWHLLRRVPLDGTPGQRRTLLGTDGIATYHGIDLCPEMVDSCRIAFAGIPQASFSQGDLNEPEAFLGGTQPFDLYFNSYGSLSHVDDQHLGRLVDAVLAHQPGPGALVIDVHGQYSPEWPCYWGYSRDPAAPHMQPYNMVWMYPPAERARRLEEQRDYRIRYWRGEELRTFLCERAAVGSRLRDLRLLDRSILVGRHMDTACFNPDAPPLRRAVNRLFEYNRTTAHEHLRCPALPLSGDPTIDCFLRGFTTTWNTLGAWFASVVEGSDGPRADDLCRPDGPVPAVLRPGLEALEAQARNLAWFEPGDPQANLLQPQFGLLLRQCELHAQQGLGCGHGLVAVLRFGPAEGR